MTHFPPLLFLSIYTLAGCSNTTETRRWSSMKPSENPLGNDVEAKVYVAPDGTTGTNPAASNPLSGWSDGAQAAFVTGMAAKTKTADAFRSALSNKQEGPAPSSFTAVDRQKRLLIVTLTRPAGYVPGDRIARVVVRILPINFSIGGYSIVQTARTTVNVTSLTRTASLEASLTAGTPSTAPVNASAGLKSTGGTQTVTPLTEAPETLTVDVIPSCMRIVQEGAHSVDLTGNIKIGASLLTETLPIFAECNLATQDAAGMQPVSGVGTNSYFVVDPSLTFKGGKPQVKAGSAGGALRGYPIHSLMAKIVLDYILRRVDAGARSYDESVQDVTLVSGRSTTCQVILPVSQTMPPLYEIRGPATTDHSKGIPVVMGKEKGAALLFTTMDAATDTANWLMTVPGSPQLGTTRIYNASGTLTPQRFEPLSGADECGEQQFVKDEKARLAALQAPK